MKESLNFKHFRFGCLILFLNSMFPWVTWNAGVLLPPILGLLFSLPYLPTLKISRGKFLPYGFALILLTLWLCIRLNFFGLVFRAIAILPLLVITSLEDDLKNNILNYILKWFSIILAVSICIYIPVKLGVPLPHSTISYDSRLEGYDVFYNYYFVITKPYSYRFQSVFLEPGHLTMGLAPMLYIYRYDLKNKYVAILFLAQLLSLSLAGYIIMTAGILIQNSLDVGPTKKSFKSLVLTLGTIAAIICFLPKLTGMDDVFDQALFFRLEDMSSNGVRRTSEDFDALYDKVKDTPAIWTGIAKNTDIYGGAGFKKFIVSYGIIGVFLSILLYIMPFKIYKSKSVFFFCLILLALLYQDAYPYWSCIMMTSILGASYLYNEKAESICK